MNIVNINEAPYLSEGLVFEVTENAENNAELVPSFSVVDEDFSDRVMVTVLDYVSFYAGEYTEMYSLVATRIVSGEFIITVANSGGAQFDFETESKFFIANGN